MYMLIDCNYGDQGYDVICVSKNLEKINKRMEKLKVAFSKKHDFSDTYEVVEVEDLDELKNEYNPPQRIVPSSVGKIEAEVNFAKKELEK
jgi:hypothetical protein